MGFSMPINWNDGSEDTTKFDWTRGGTAKVIKNRANSSLHLNDQIQDSIIEEGLVPPDLLKLLDEF